MRISGSEGVDLSLKPQKSNPEVDDRFLRIKIL